MLYFSELHDNSTPIVSQFAAECTVNSGSSQMVSWLIKCPSLPLKQAFLNTICYLIEVTDVNVHLAITSCVMCSQISPEKGTSS